MKMSSELLDLDENLFFKKDSSRHHYLPIFFINGFTNDLGKLFVYDKLKDEINQESKSPKSVFFEWDRNTINVTNDTESSVIEDLLYTKLDSKCSEVIKHFNQPTFENILLNEENMSAFLIFVIVLFWRIPFTDWAVNDILDRAKINSQSIDPDVLRKDESFRKMQRIQLINHTIDQIIGAYQNFKIFSSVQQFNQDVFVLGDSPLIFKFLPNKYQDFVTSEYFIAINSRRLYSSTQKEPIKYSITNIRNYNYAVINQSNRYVVCANLDLLKSTIDNYKNIKDNLILINNEQVFKEYSNVD